MTDKEVEKVIKRGVTDGILWAGFYFGVAGMLAVSVFNYFTPYDDTDFNGQRSGMEILTDCRTGLQYLSTREGGLTPRLNTDQTQIKEECK